MRLRTILLSAASLLLLMLLLTGAAAYSLTAQPRQVQHHLQIPFGNYGRLWLFTNPCTAHSGGNIEISFQQALSIARPGVFYDSGSYRILQDEIDRSFRSLATLPTAPACR